MILSLNLSSFWDVSIISFPNGGNYIKNGKESKYVKMYTS